MRTTFLDYYKMILDKVSFDHRLFTKEYQKAVSKLQANEIGDLNRWLTAKGLQPVLLDRSKKTDTMR